MDDRDTTMSETPTSALAGARWSRPADWRIAILRALLVHSVLGWVYILLNAVSHPDTMEKRLTHFLAWPREIDFGVACVVVTVACVLALHELTAGGAAHA
jgi:hypothetical protein